jgi:hypothetical protein
MEKNTSKTIPARLVVLLLLAVLLMMSAAQAVVHFDIQTLEKTSGSPSHHQAGMLGDNYYTWEDLFNDATKIDPTMSYNYDIAGGSAMMKNTYTLWTDPAWTRMKPITVTATDSLTNYAIHLTVTYDSDMRPDYGDLRFKHDNSGDFYLSYWIENMTSSSASVWVKIPTLPQGNSQLYMFYGNPSAQSQSDYYSVFTDWQEQWANDERLSYHENDEGAWDPDVAFGNGDFLVSWEEGQAYWVPWSWGYKQEIRASMYDPSGNRVVFDNLIFKDNTLYYRNENPSSDSSDGTFFVAWQHWEPVANPSDDTLDIKARTVVRNGDALQLGSVIDVSSADHCQADANVQFDSVNNRFCVAWEDARAGYNDYDVWGRLYDANGNPIGNQVDLTNNEANNQCEPWLAYDPVHQQYMLVYESGITGDNGPFSIEARIFDKNLNQIGSTISIATGSDTVDYNYPCVEFSEQPQRYLVTWNNDDISAGDYWGNIWGKLLDTSGNVVVDTFQIKSGDFIRTDIAPYLTSSFFVSFNSKGPGSNSGVIWGKLVSSNGNVYIDDVQLSASTSAQADWASIAVGNDRLFVGWEDIRIDYPFPWDGMSDSFGNLWHLNIPSGSEVTTIIGDEKELVLIAQITSIILNPDNLLAWYDFNASFQGTISFDVLNGAGDIVLIQGINPGQSLQSLDPAPIRLRAHFTRSIPSYSPSISSWMVRYIGVDEVAPVTLLDHITGTQGLNGWYTSESVTVWLTSYDLPAGTGSGVNHTYYTLNQGATQEYIVDSGIILVVTEQMYMTGQWAVNFWSVDRAGNIEDNTQPDNTIQVKIDAARPEVTITEPVHEQQVYIPFWVRANASDNAGVDRVEFDIEPFGHHPGLPYVDTEPPYEWLCNVSDINGTWTTNLDGTPTLGVNKMVRAQVFDKSGQSWISEVWIYIVNEASYGKYFLLGFIKNRSETDSTITFQARLLFTLQLDTIQPAVLNSGEQFVVAKDAKLGYIGHFFTIGFFKAAITEQ